jgi:y4mF family transcriptional regulator
MIVVGPRDIGRVVRDERKAQGLTQDELALLANTGRRFIVELEHGKPTSRLDRVLQVLAALGIELELRQRRPS